MRRATCQLTTLKDQGSHLFHLPELCYRQPPPSFAPQKPRKGNSPPHWKAPLHQRIQSQPIRKARHTGQLKDQARASSFLAVVPQRIALHGLPPERVPPHQPHLINQGIQPAPLTNHPANRAPLYRKAGGKVSLSQESIAPGIVTQGISIKTTVSNAKWLPQAGGIK